MEPKVCCISSRTRKKLDKLWGSTFADAGPLEKKPLGDCKEERKSNVYLLSHTLRRCDQDQWTDIFRFTINGLVVRSPLGLDSFFSSECSKGRYVNLYTVILPDIPGRNGDISTSQFYINLLAQEGLNVSGIMFNWSGADTNPPVPGRILNIRHQNIGLDPLEFSQKTLRALLPTLDLINKRVREERKRE